MMDGRVKTLHPKVHGGLLASATRGARRRDGDARHRADRSARGQPLSVRGDGREWRGYDDCIENIDIGGPAMIRAAAKNHADVAVVVEPDDYARVLDELRSTAARPRWRCARSLRPRPMRARRPTTRRSPTGSRSELGDAAPAFRAFGGKLAEALRYGENPHQSAAFYRTPEQRSGVATARQVQGKELCYNNINDTDAAFECVAEFDPKRTAACAIIKHANPCGVADGGNLLEAYRKALACDPTSAFGGIVALNRTLDAEAAREIIEIFTEVIIAPDADDEAIAIVAREEEPAAAARRRPARSARRGLTSSRWPAACWCSRATTPWSTSMQLKVVTKRAPTEAELADLRFAFSVAKHVKSNAIVYAKDRATVGIGAGQMSRVDSARIAARKAEDAAQGAEARQRRSPRARWSPPTPSSRSPTASWPREAGATAVIQPGGSMRDDEVIKAADERGLAMVFTGTRHFRH